jgi:hypothetical protein
MATAILPENESSGELFGRESDFLRKTAPCGTRRRAADPGRITPKGRPKLRVVAHSLTDARHVQLWIFHQVQCIALEVITEPEWAAMTEAERPENIMILPGIGYVCLSDVTGDWAARRYLSSLQEQQVARWRAARGIIG